MEKEFNEMILLAYKNRFSLYYQPNNCLVRTYFKDGSQHKEVGITIEDAIKKMTTFLKLEK